MLRLSRLQLDEMIAHARRGAPAEVCGILAGNEGTVAAVYPGTNVAESPLVRYEMDPSQQLAVMQQIEAASQAMVGIYHSHPHSPAYPSHIDRELAFYPDSVYVIVSLADSVRPDVRAFRMVDGQVHEEELVIDG